jgi:adenylate kinase|tara:strand:- start:3718 stop:4371 length:654 start_codon:yes stop_codon:yes gene_type:complete
MVYCVLLGLPGAGKGTQALSIASDKGILHISTGDMFREASANRTSLGLEAQGYMSKGELVPDEVTIGMLLERIEEEDAASGFMLDGFPRTIKQAEALDIALESRSKKIDVVPYIKVPEDLLMARLTGRWSCPDCSDIYHSVTKPPKMDGICDSCAGHLLQRSDDQPETVKTRLDANREWTEALATYYEDQNKLRSVDGTGDPNLITERIVAVLDEIF